MKLTDTMLSKVNQTQKNICVSFHLYEIPNQMKLRSGNLEVRIVINFVGRQYWETVQVLIWDADKILCHSLSANYMDICFVIIY